PTCGGRRRPCRPPASATPRTCPRWSSRPGSPRAGSGWTGCGPTWTTGPRGSWGTSHDLPARRAGDPARAGVGRRAEPVHGLRLHRKVYEDPAPFVDVGDGTVYTSYIPHAFVATWSEHDQGPAPPTGRGCCVRPAEGARGGSVGRLQRGRAIPQRLRAVAVPAVVRAARGAPHRQGNHRPVRPHRIPNDRPALGRAGQAGGPAQDAGRTREAAERGGRRAGHRRDDAGDADRALRVRPPAAPGRPGPLQGAG